MLLRVLADPSDQARKAARDMVQALLQGADAQIRPSRKIGHFPPTLDGRQRVARAMRYDEDCPEEERMPDLIHARFLECGKAARLVVNGGEIGDALTDKAALVDGYRFHDAFHLAHAAVLGWSPVMRALLHRRRRSLPEVDEREDGGRAQMIEEAVSHVVFVHGRDGNEVRNPARIDSAFLAHLTRLTLGLEVESRDPNDWARAVAEGWRAFDALREGKCRAVFADMTRSRLFLASDTDLPLG